MAAVSAPETAPPAVAISGFCRLRFGSISGSAQVPNSRGLARGPSGRRSRHVELEMHVGAADVDDHAFDDAAEQHLAGRIVQAVDLPAHRLAEGTEGVMAVQVGRLLREAGFDLHEAHGNGILLRSEGRVAGAERALVDAVADVEVKQTAALSLQCGALLTERGDLGAGGDALGVEREVPGLDRVPQCIRIAQDAGDGVPHSDFESLGAAGRGTADRALNGVTARTSVHAAVAGHGGAVHLAPARSADEQPAQQVRPHARPSHEEDAVTLQLRLGALECGPRDDGRRFHGDPVDLGTELRSHRAIDGDGAVVPSAPAIERVAHHASHG